MNEKDSGVEAVHHHQDDEFDNSKARITRPMHAIACSPANMSIHRRRLRP